jgi:hypothetical protein
MLVEPRCDEAARLAVHIEDKGRSRREPALPIVRRSSQLTIERRSELHPARHSALECGAFEGSIASARNLRARCALRSDSWRRPYHPPPPPPPDDPRRLDSAARNPPLDPLLQLDPPLRELELELDALGVGAETGAAMLTAAACHEPLAPAPPVRPPPKPVHVPCDAAPDDVDGR